METNYQKQAEDFLKKTNSELTITFDKFDYHFIGDKEKRNIFNVTLKNKKSSYTFKFGASLYDSCKEIKRAKIYSDKELTIFDGFMHQRQKITFSHSIYTTYAVLLAISEGTKELESLMDFEKIQNDYNLYLNSIKEFNKKHQRYEWIERIPKIDEIQARIRKRISEAIKEAKETTETFLIEQKDNFEAPDAYDILACLTKYDPDTFENFCSEYGYDEDSRKAEKTYNAVKDEYSHLCMLYSPEEMELLQEIC